MDLRQRDGFPPLVVEVWGDAALFTRPDAKVERLTYPVMTPTAAVGVLEAIFWKPEFRWDVVAVEVLAPVREGRVRRNETTQVLPREAALRGERIDTAAHRTQRAATILLDVRYRLHAHAALRSHATDPPAKYRDQFRRRVERGACFSQPYLGTREFTASFGVPTDRSPIDLSGDLGIMPHTITHGKDGRDPRTSWFRARLHGGVMVVPVRGLGAEAGE